MACWSPCTGGHHAVAEADAITHKTYLICSASLYPPRSSCAASGRSREAVGCHRADGSDAGTGWEAEPSSFCPGTGHWESSPWDICADKVAQHTVASASKALRKKFPKAWWWWGCQSPIGSKLILQAPGGLWQLLEKVFQWGGLIS